MDRPAQDFWFRVAVGVLLVASPWIHGDSLKRLGLRLDTFRERPHPPLAGFGAGRRLGRRGRLVLKSIDPPESAAVAIGTYFAWALLQQYALQSVVLLRLEDIGLRAGRRCARRGAVFAACTRPIRV